VTPLVPREKFIDSIKKVGQNSGDQPSGRVSSSLIQAFYSFCANCVPRFWSLLCLFLLEIQHETSKKCEKIEDKDN
jgi:hypothetical protein